MIRKIFSILSVLIIVFAVGTAYPAYCETQGIINNAGFEEATGVLPNGWITEIFNKTAGVTEFRVEEGSAYSGAKYVSIINNKPNVAALVQEVNVQPDKVYKVNCWIKTENIANQAGSANIMLIYGTNGKGIYTSTEYKDTKNNWQKLEFYIRTLSSYNKLTFKLELGGVGTLNQGKASFDDVSMELVDNPGSNITVSSFYVPGKSNITVTDNAVNKTGAKTPIFIITLIVLGIAVVCFIAFIEIKFSKRRKKNDNEAEEESEEENEEET